MKEKLGVVKTHSRSENSSHRKTFKEEHLQMASERNKSEYRSSKKNHSNKSEHRSAREGSKKKNYRNEINYDESYEELSRKKRKIERELHALDLEEAAAAKKQKIDKTSKHQTVSDDDKSTSDENKQFASVKNRQKIDMTSKHQIVSDEDKSTSGENKRFSSGKNSYRRERKTSKHQIINEKDKQSSEKTSERNRQNLDRKTSKHKNTSDRNEPASDENKRLASEKNRLKQVRRRTSNFQNVAVKEESVSDEDKASERNRHKAERVTSRHQNVSIKDEPLSDENDRNRSSSGIRNNELGPLSDENDRNRSSSGIRNNELGHKDVKDKEKPDFAVSGKLAEDTNIFNGVVIKYNEPSEARKPKRRWRLYPFKGESDLPFIPIHRQSAYLLGRTRAIADIPIDHPSCSKQHAVLQFRLVPYTRDDGTKGRRVRPYIIDLESANGTFVNNNRINPRCYVELMEKDVIKFGFSSREYVLLHEESKNDDYDDVRDSS